MSYQHPMSSVQGQGRKRSRVACLTCRELKRKCDGAYPCGTCVRFEYECRYKTDRPRAGIERHVEPRAYPTGGRAGAHAYAPAASAAGAAAGASSATTTEAPPPHAHAQAQSLEANSGSAFVRRLALRLDPKRNPRMHTFAWNPFLGSRLADHIPAFRSITDVLSQARMQDLAATYFEKIDPTYGFIDRHEIQRLMQQRWALGYPVQQVEDAILCGIAALGCLYSQVVAETVELDLLETAKILLAQTMSDPPTVGSISAWILRVTYLRVAGTHYPAWMASCMVLHMIDAANLNVESPSDSGVPSPQGEDVDAEVRRRLVGVAQHLNIWMSFDMGLTRVALSNTTTTIPRPRPGDYTHELIELLQYSFELDPDRKNTTAGDLEAGLHAVLGRIHTIPSSVLAQCNLALCMCRRLRSLEVTLSETVLQRVLVLTSKGIQAAQDLLRMRSPWHHMAYVPFQIVCVLLAIDTVSSISQLRDAVQCLKDISAVYNTSATQDALKTARSLVLLHQRGKEMFASALSDILQVCEDENGGMASISGDLPMSDQMLPLGDSLSDFQQHFDMDQFLSSEFFWNAGGNVF